MRKWIAVSIVIILGVFVRRRTLGSRKDRIFDARYLDYRWADDAV